MMLEDKAIIETGSTTGVGEAIARACAAQGARVLIHGLEKDLGAAVADSLGPAAALHIDDIADPGAPGRIVAAAVKAFGKVDGLVNNAAWIVRSDLGDTDAALFDRAMAINARAPMFMVRAALDQLKRHQGAVINIGSINAHCGEPRQLAYSMSKAALQVMSKNLANVLSTQGVRVTHFNLGWVLTPNEYKLKIREGLAENWPKTVSRAWVPTGRMTKPEEVAAHAVFWLSDQSRPMSGGVIDLEQYAFLGRNPPKED